MILRAKQPVPPGPESSDQEWFDLFWLGLTPEYLRAELMGLRIGRCCARVGKGKRGEGSDLRLKGTRDMTGPSLHLHPPAPSSSQRGQAKGQYSMHSKCESMGDQKTQETGIPPTISHRCLLFCLRQHCPVKNSPSGSNILPHL